MQKLHSIAKLFAGRYRLLSLLGGNGVRVLLYHHIAESDNEFTDHLGVRHHPDEFAWQLDHIVRDYDAVDLATVLSGKLPKRPLLITFDDAYRSVLDVAGPMLKERGLPAVFFLSSEPVYENRPMLDNMVNYLANRFGLQKLEMAITGAPPTCATVPHLISDVIAMLPYERRAGLLDELITSFEIEDEVLAEAANLYLRREELPGLEDMGIELGCHTGSHIHCRALSAEGADREIKLARDRIEEMSGKPVRSFSYPYDSIPSEAALQSVRSSGFQAEFRVCSRAMPRGHDGPVWYRTCVSNVPDPESFFATVEVMPRLRHLWNRFG